MSANKVARDLDAVARHNITPPPQPGGRMIARITAIGTNTLTVTVGVGAEVSAGITVAKATKVMPALQIDPSLDADGKSYTYAFGGGSAQTRTSTGPEGAETQIVIPPYFVGDTIEIGPIPPNLIGEALAIGGVTLPADLRYQEVNSPRFWSEA